MIGAKLDKKEIAALLEFTAGRPRGRDAAILHGLAEGIKRRGRQDTRHTGGP